MAEKAKTKGGCRKTAIFAGLGCLAIPVLGLIFAAFSLGWGYMFYSHDGPVPAEGASLTVARSLPSSSSGDAAEGIEPGVDFEQMQQAGARGAAPVHLVIDLEEGEFEIRPGPPGSQIRAEGNFDPRDYELSQETEEGPDGQPRKITLTFRRKVPLLFYLLRGGFNDDEHMHHLFIEIPEDLPIDLDLRISKGDSESEIGGLTLTGLKADLRMGEHDITVSRPINGHIERAEFSHRMGEVGLAGLGNLKAREFSIRGGMGELEADFDGEWAAGFTTRVDVLFSMGECRIGVPESVRVSPDSTYTMFLGDVRDLMNGAGPHDPNAPTIEIHAAAKMGEFRVVQN